MGAIDLFPVGQRCAVPGCHDERLRTGRFPCGQGSWRAECYVNWAATDPEDREPYAQYLAAIPQGRRSM